MRQWTYSWNSSDGLRHEGEVRARSKDDAYAELRKRGIRPIRVTERIVPVVRRGFKGLRKRDVSVIILLAIAIAALVWLFLPKPMQNVQPIAPPSVDELAENPDAREQMRRVIEERKAIEEKCRTDFSERVKKGTMTKEAANEMFRAMGMKELE